MILHDMKILRSGIIAAALATITAATAADRTMSITLDETIARARSGSLEAAVALNTLKSAYWSYRSFRAELLPEVNFNATLPSYTKSYNAYQLESGAYTFVRSNYLNATATMSVDQSIWLTGGTLSVNTSLDFLRQLDEGSSRFMSIPVAIKLTQPIFGVNTIKWDRRIEPVRYEEAKADFLSQTEGVAITAITYYFNLLNSREQTAIARQNLDNANRLYEVAKVKREMGQISRNDLLQMELNRLNAESALTSAESAHKSHMFKLRSFLNIEDDVELVPQLPGPAPDVDIVYADVLDKAMTRNALVKNVRRRQLEADYEVAKARGAMRDISLFAQIGYTGTDRALPDAYNSLRSNQVVEVGISIPLLDWGKRRGRVKVAQSNREVTEIRLRQEVINFKEDLFILVERFNNQQRQVDIASQADTIAVQRYDTNVETYMIGRISTLDLNDSQTRKDEARIEYISELYLYWYYYYQIRSLTLWDYAAGTDIDADFNLILK